jgi:hypothetical protein
MRRISEEIQIQRARRAVRGIQFERHAIGHAREKRTIAA